jgi:hypothetical protein
MNTIKKMTISEMKAAHKEIGYHWFSEDAMSFFNTIIETQPNKANIFITSERMEKWQPKMYTLRWFNPETKHIDTLGEFRQHSSLEEARLFRSEYTREMM